MFGKTRVLITYSKSSEVVAMFNEDSSVSSISETDSEGGIRNTEEQSSKKEIIFTDENRF